MKPIESIFLPQTRWYTTRHFQTYALVASDLLALMAAFAAATLAWSIAIEASDIAKLLGHGQSGLGRIPAYLLLSLVTMAALHIKGHYAKRKPFSNEVKDVLAVIGAVALLDVTLLFMTRWQFSRGIVLISWSLAPVFVILFRWLAKHALIAMDAWARPMVIVGWGDNAVETALAFRDEPLMGMNLIAFVVPPGQTKPAHQLRDRQGQPIPSISMGNDPARTIRRLGNPHVVVALELGGMDRYQEMILQLSRDTDDVQLVPTLRGLPLYGMEANHFFAHEVLLLTMRNNLARRFPQLVKRWFDLIVSASLLVLASPLLLYIASRVAASGGPVFFGHTRVGQHNKSFKCYKFRTMAPNADQLLAELLARDPDARAEWERDFKLKNDPRVTPIGRFLRKTSLDEIPQLWNVLKGEMSLVGPRPVVTAELERYGSNVDYYVEARPGITGLWQISGRNDVSYDTRVYLDAWYVKNWSLFNDIVILFKTVKVIFRTEGAY